MCVSYVYIYMHCFHHFLCVLWYIQKFSLQNADVARTCTFRIQAFSYHDVTRNECRHRRNCAVIVWKGYNKNFTYLLTYLLQDIIRKADSHSTFQKISCFLCGTRRFISVFSKVRHWTLSRAS